GTVQIKKPGRMRWEYVSPEKKTFVADGRMIYSYVPADKQVIRSPMPADDAATTAVLFLAGKGNLTRDFNVSYVEGGSDDTWSLRLDPKQKQKDYDWLILVVDRQALHIRGLTAADQQGGRSTFQFTNYRENTGLPDNVFVFKIPRGTDVITAGDRRWTPPRRHRGARGGDPRGVRVFSRRQHEERARCRPRAGLRPRGRRVHEDRARQPREHRGADVAGA